MALVSDLTLIGFDTRFAEYLGDTVSASVNAAGVILANATLLTTTINSVITIPLSTGVRLPKLISFKNSLVIVKNSPGSTAILQVYPFDATENIDGPAGVAYALAIGAGKIFVKLTSAGWISI